MKQYIQHKSAFFSGFGSVFALLVSAQDAAAYQRAAQPSQDYWYATGDYLAQAMSDYGQQVRR
jgi:hypothetical protein